jgi:high affinity Mn2+ porin
MLISLSRRRRWTCVLFIALLTLALTPQTRAASAISTSPSASDAAVDENWNIKAQATVAHQHKPSFNAAYAGRNSLSNSAENSDSLSGTAYLGIRLGGNARQNTAFYFNPEVVQGRALSNLTGLGGLSNGELQKSASAAPTLYRARAFVRQVWNTGDERETVASEANQLGGTRSQERWELTAGNVAITDLFDQSKHAHDARTQFMNWSFLTHGAYDYAADVRGYTWGLALEYSAQHWALRAGRFLEPKASNGQALNWHIFDSYGDQIEFERRYVFGEQLGQWRVLLFRNVAVMGSYQDALKQSSSSGSAPNFDSTRRQQSKRGLGFSIEQSLSKHLGLFAKAAAHDGKTETYSFTEIDRSAAAGLTWLGGAWQRPADKIGLAWAMNGLSDAHRTYLAAGGYGFFIGDGQLRQYKPEQIWEAYYLTKLGQQQWTLNLQHISNPGYNAEHGPVQVYGLRWHRDF